MVDAALQRWAQENVPAIDIHTETEKFRDHTFKTAMTDWAGAWRNWMRRAAGDSRATRPPTESFRERDARQAALKVKAWTGGLCHDRKALGEERAPLPFERGYVKPADTIEGEAHEQHRIAG